MTTIAACIVWYDEPLESIDRCLRSLPLVADELVIADGRWEGFDDEAPAASMGDQRDLVYRLATQLFEAPVMIGCEEPMPKPWTSQVDKRRNVYRIGSLISDWLLVLDMDEHVERCESRLLRDFLRNTELLSGDIGMRTIHGPSAPEGVHKTPRLFATKLGITVEGSHNGIRTLRGDWLTGDPKYVPIVERLDARPFITCYHTQGADRPKEREMADRRYRRWRREHEVEGWPWPDTSDPA